MTGDLLVLSGAHVEALLRGRDRELIEIVRRAYLAHGDRRTVVPHAAFLRLPPDPANRILALPAFVDDGAPVAGVKWIASFPANLRSGLDRASAVLVLNSVETGRPLALLEGSLISLKRTAASAALAAESLHGWDEQAAFGVVGCGQINLHTLLMVGRMRPLGSVWAYDVEPGRVVAFAERLAAAFPSVSVYPAADARDVLDRCRVASFATTAGVPYLNDPAALRPGQTILHISLRDLGSEVMLAADNVVDDVDHVCQANTSVHLAEQRTGGRTFIRCTLADVLAGRAAPRRTADAPVIFSPFGLGILDLAVGRFVWCEAKAAGAGTAIPGFAAEPWDRQVTVGGPPSAAAPR